MGSSPISGTLNAENNSKKTTCKAGSLFVLSIRQKKTRQSEVFAVAGRRYFG
jgi:hypothetical protein